MTHSSEWTDSGTEEFEEIRTLLRSEADHTVTYGIDIGRLRIEYQDADGNVLGKEDRDLQENERSGVPGTDDGTPIRIVLLDGNG